MRLALPLFLMLSFWMVASCMDYQDAQKSECAVRGLDYDHGSGECFDKTPGDQAPRKRNRK